jgi:predicted nucleic acid binding AN1-type Zn finger protein
MRINEIADAKEQLALLRLIMDNTWTAIAQQARVQDTQKAAKPIAAAVKKPTKKLLNVAARLGAKAKTTAQPAPAQQQAQPAQVQQLSPRQPLQQRPSNSIKAVSTTQNMSTSNMPNAAPQITPAPKKF